MIIGIKQFIYEMPTPLKVDVLFKDRLKKDELIANIMKDGMVSYDKEMVMKQEI